MMHAQSIIIWNFLKVFINVDQTCQIEQMISIWMLMRVARLPNMRMK